MDFDTANHFSPVFEALLSNMTRYKKCMLLDSWQRGYHYRMEAWNFYKYKYNLKHGDGKWSDNGLASN